MDLSSYLDENTNVVELYFCQEEINSNTISFSCSWDKLPRIPLNIFKSRIDQVIIEFHKGDIVYCYDQGNDSQRVYQKELKKDKVDGKIYISSLNELTYPTHRFPCTNNINDKRTIHRISYKINNRMSFIIEKENELWTLYMRYNHSSIVDIDSMNKEWNEKLKQLQKNIYSKY
jgi:hypothetical protein